MNNGKQEHIDRFGYRPSPHPPHLSSATGLTFAANSAKVIKAWSGPSRFDVQVTLEGHYNVFHQILTDCGIPAMFYTDRRTVSEYKRKNNAFDDEDTFTQFSYACHQLDVEKKQLAQHKPKAV